MTQPGGGSRLLTRKLVYPGRVVRLELERVELPTGVVVELEMIHHPGAAAVVPLLDSGEVVLVRQFRHAAGGFLFEVPAGKLDSREPPLACAHRELKEESGYAAGRMQELGSIHTTPGFTDELIHLFLARDLTPCGQCVEHDEVLSVTTLPFAEALAMAGDGRITDAKTIAALFRASRALGG
jgi:ADP-ribose pyrophosphatase